MLTTELISPVSRVFPTRGQLDQRRFRIAVATAADRQEIYRVRHEVYARELRQHQTNTNGQLSDALDAHNVYLVVRMAGELAGFVSLTPPSAPSYSIDKYIARSDLPFSFDDGLYEVRLLTVLPPYRGQNVATLLMYAAYRWAESHGATQIAAIGRREIIELYVKAGLRSLGLSAQSGAVTYDFLHATVAELRTRTLEYGELFARLETRTDWRLNFPFRKPATCFHGGAFFAAVGERFDDLTRHRSIINADVLDAWFPPAPAVLETLEAELPWLLRTSPPTACTGLIEAIAEARGVTPANVLPGGGSSDLIFRALRQWLNPTSRVLILDPTYGEYAHVLEKVIGCRVTRFTLERANGFVVNCDHLQAALADAYDLVVIVNPNSPTGRHIPRPQLEELLRHAPANTRVWVDETYVEYAGAQQSLERFAAGSEHVIVCKSMSKVYALSGVRVAYLCAGAHQMEELRAVTPPWVVSLPAQVAAVKALSCPGYYAARYAETHELRNKLASELERLGCAVLPGVANFLLCQLPEDGRSAGTLVAACRERGLFLRDAALMGTQLGSRAIRIAVKDAATNVRMIEIIAQCLG
ncbi:MAG: aminotransferase class I/II-fold pyridoxal phosphate-dependent enzyme [Opitutus sp.]